METATLMLIGSGIQAGAKVSGGMAAREAGEFNAAGLERRATEERAAGQRAAGERRRETELVLSRQRALGAASGAVAGPSVLDLAGDTAARGEYQAQGETYTAETRARALKDRAAAARYEGRNAFIGSILEGVGHIALGVGRTGTMLRTTPSSTRASPYYYGN